MKKEELIKKIESRDEDIVKKTLEEIGNLNIKEAIQPILNLLNKTSSEEIIDAAIWTLSRIAPSKQIIPLLKSDNKFIILYTIETLGRIEAKESRAQLREFLKDPDDEIRAMATWAIGKVQDKSSYEPLLDILKNDPNPAVRSNAAWAIKKLNILNSIKPLKELYQKEDDEMVLYNIQEAIKSIEAYHETFAYTPTFSYKCPFFSEQCRNLNIQELNFEDKNIIIHINKTDECDKAKICNLNIKINK
ncbi:MAG: HEAT repeat domain-containing protein [Candidatus Helarchaeota archaeon]